jgi:hypothetical protein
VFGNPLDPDRTAVALALSLEGEDFLDSVVNETAGERVFPASPDADAAPSLPMP